MILPIQPRINYFGNGSDGDLNTSGNVSFTSTLDGPTVYKNFKNLTINAGHTVTVSNRCKGLVIYCLGNCIINSNLTMTSRGCIATGVNVNPYNLNKCVRRNCSFTDYSIPAVGAAGGPAVHNVGYNIGSTGVNGQCGGGSSGQAQNGMGSSVYSGAGSAGTSYSGGSGGGACIGNITLTGGSAVANGGAGGYGVAVNASGPSSHGGGGGAGNPGGVGAGSKGGTGFPGETGTGGLIILIVRGNLTIGSTGLISSDGSAGGGGSAVFWAWGGSSGGGSITLLYGGTLSNTGTVRANGGGGGIAGGAGSVRIAQIREF